MNFECAANWPPATYGALETLASESDRQQGYILTHSNYIYQKNMFSGPHLERLEATIGFGTAQQVGNLRHIASQWLLSEDGAAPSMSCTCYGRQVSTWRGR